MDRMTVTVTVLAAAVLGGCAYSKMTSFRKHGASMEDERRDWGLCGGDFHPNGRLRTTPDGKVVSCMRNKGYMTLNDYYVEQQISFVNVRQPELITIPREALQTCRFAMVETGPCRYGAYFVAKQDLAAAIKCMSGWGFEPTIPDQGSGMRIVDNPRKLDPHFCLSLTPRNGKGGISFNGWRWE